MVRPRSVCNTPGCPSLATHGGQCRTCYDLRNAVYRDPRWAPLEQRVRTEQPLCAVAGCGRPGEHVDHIHPVSDGGAPFDRDNLENLCPSHHSQKTAAERAGVPWEPGVVALNVGHNADIVQPQRVPGIRTPRR